MSDTKDDGGPFHPSGKGTDATSMYGASFRAVAAMHAMAANRIAFPNAPADDLAKLAKWDTDALIAELKK